MSVPSIEWVPWTPATTAATLRARVATGREDFVLISTNAFATAELPVPRGFSWYASAGCTRAPTPDFRSVGDEAVVGCAATQTPNGMLVSFWRPWCGEILCALGGAALLVERRVLSRTLDHCEDALPSQLPSLITELSLVGARFGDSLAVVPELLSVQPQTVSEPLTNRPMDGLPPRCRRAVGVRAMLPENAASIAVQWAKALARAYSTNAALSEPSQANMR
jgi:hypothetical protein